MTVVDRLNGINSGLAIKAPVKAATTANITLSGEQTIDGISIVSGDRVLVRDQTDTAANGIYVASTGAWSRSLDFDGTRDIVEGTIITVTRGTLYGDSLWRISTASPVPGSAIAFARSGSDATLSGIFQSATRAGIKSAGRAINDTAYLSEAGREGFFVLRSGNYSTQIAADTLEGIYLEDDTIASTTAAWVRVWENYVRPEWWGADPTEAADSAAAVNAAVAFALDEYWLYAKGPVTVRLRGRYLMNSPLEVFYFKAGAYQFVSINIEGDSDGYVISKQTGLKFTSVDVPGIMIYGARRVRFAGFMVRGPGATSNPNTDDLLNDTGATPWWNPAGTMIDSRYSMCAGIHIDPFSDIIPPDGGYPGYNGSGGSTDHYVARKSSSGIVFDNMSTPGWIVGIMLSGAAASQQDDHILMRNPNFTGCKVGVGVGQDQSRGCVLEDVFAIGCSTIVDCYNYGTGIGVMPSIYNGTVGYVKYLITADGSRSRASINNIYAESILSLGYWGGGGYPLDLVSCTIKFSEVAGERIDSHFTIDGPVNVRGGMMSKYNGATYRLRFATTNSVISFDGVTFDAVPQFTRIDGVEFENCKLRYVNSGTTFGIVKNLSRLSNSPTASSVDAHMAPSGVYCFNAEHAYRKWINYEGWIQASIETASITFNGDGTGSFTAADAGAYAVGEFYNTITSTSIEVYRGTNQSVTLLSIGRVSSIAGSTINLIDCPRSLVTGSHGIYIQRLPTFRDRSTGDTSSGSNSITNVTNVSTWAIGKYIRGAGIPIATTITAVSGTTLTISRNATATATGIPIYDAVLTLEGGQSAAVGAPASGVWFKGDRLAARNITAAQPDANNMILDGYICTVTGSPGTWRSIYSSTVTPAT